MLKKIRELLSQKGQGTVEYGLIIGFVAIIAIYMLNASGLKDTVQQNITDAKDASTSIQTEYNDAFGRTGQGGANPIQDGGEF
jgi:Flp pilus assembly pilin Flp